VIVKTSREHTPITPTKTLYQITPFQLETQKIYLRTHSIIPVRGPANTILITSVFRSDVKYEIVLLLFYLRREACIVEMFFKVRVGGCP